MSLMSVLMHVSVLYKQVHSYITQSDSDTIEVMFCDGPHVALVPYSRASNKLSLKFKLKLDYFYKLRAKLKLPKFVFI
jgi:hypothetical protein